MKSWMILINQKTIKTPLCGTYKTIGNIKKSKLKNDKVWCIFSIGFVLVEKPLNIVQEGEGNIFLKAKFLAYIEEI